MLISSKEVRDTSIYKIEKLTRIALTLEVAQSKEDAHGRRFSYDANTRMKNSGPNICEVSSYTVHYNTTNNRCRAIILRRYSTRDCYEGQIMFQVHELGDL